jgi:parallel beta-helix repeat protein
MKKIYISAILLVSVKCFSQTAWHVSTTGNDATGTGSAGNPWASLYKATSTVTTAGDTIRLHAGTYSEKFVSMLAPGVHLIGDGKAVTHLTDTFTYRYVQERTYLLQLYSSTNTNGNQQIKGIDFDGLSKSACAILVNKRNNVEIHHNNFKNYYNEGVDFNGFDNVISEPPSWSDTVGKTWATGNSFHDNTMSNCSQLRPEIGDPDMYAIPNPGVNGSNVLDNHNLRDAIGRGCLQIGGQLGFRMYNDTIINKSRPLSGIIGTGGYRHSHNGWAVKMFNHGFIRDCKFYNNYLEVAPFHMAASDNSHFGFVFEVNFFNKDCEWYGNRFKGELDLNYNVNPYVHDNDFGFDDTTINTLGGDGAIILEFSTIGGVIENNTIRNVKDGIYFVPREGNNISGLTVRKNLLYNINTFDGSGVAIGGGSGESANYTNVLIEHNTVVGATDNARKIFRGIDFYNCAIANNFSIKNNIIQGFTNSSLRVRPYTGMTNSSYNNNLFHDNTYLPFGDFAGQVLPLPATNTTTGWITANPLFVGSGSYALQSGSPAKNAATDGTDIGYTGSSGGGGDVTPPTVASTNPANGATGVAPGVYNVVINFTEAMNTATLNSSNITGLPAGSFTTGSTYVSINTTLLASTTYTVNLSGAITDVAGNALTPVSFSFTTGVGIIAVNKKLKGHWRKR